LATLLLIDDSDVQRAEIRQAIEGAKIFERIIEAEDGIRGLRLLLDAPVDVVLCDLDLPGLDGEKLLRVKESSPSGANIAFLFLTASKDTRRKARLLENGACDAIDKPFHPADLIARLQLHLKVKRLQDALEAQNAALALMSTVDELTGLRTRRYIQEYLAIEFLRARRYKGGLALLMVDLDEFKDVNDSHGHPAGDVVLRGVADLLQRELRASDVAGRYGGDELIVVLPQNSARGAAALSERWRVRVEETEFELADGGSTKITLSVGIAEYNEKFTTPDELVAAADTALYRAKQKGRNRVVVQED
jgi:diguanylate cyclase (GGDEF)-like protein